MSSAPMSRPGYECSVGTGKPAFLFPMLPVLLPYVSCAYVASLDEHTNGLCFALSPVPELCLCGTPVYRLQWLAQW